MATYVIGDVHGQYAALMDLLANIDYQVDDELWFVGDLVNRGPQSLEVLNWIADLGNTHKIVLGNHDVAFLYHYFNRNSENELVNQVRNHSNENKIIDKLCHSPLFYPDESRKVILSHAGWHPQMELNKAQQAQAAFQRRIVADPKQLLNDIYQNNPKCMNAIKNDNDALIFLVNAMTRMRYLDKNACLNFDKVNNGDAALKPWFEWKNQNTYKCVFGHWALLGLQIQKKWACIDAGAGWNQTLVAFDVDRWEIAGQATIKV